MIVKNLFDGKISQECFFRDYHTKRPCVLGKEGGPLSGLMSMETLNGILKLCRGDELNQSYYFFPPTDRTIESYELVNQAKGPEAFQGMMIKESLKAHAVRNLIADGGLINIDSLQNLNETCLKNKMELEQLLSLPVSSSLYFNGKKKPNSFSSETHFDFIDIFAVQAVGSKRWVIKSPIVNNPIRKFDEYARYGGAINSQETVMDIELKAGECLYLPRGYGHAVIPTENNSLNITLDCLSKNIYQFREWQLSTQSNSNFLRMGLDMNDPVSAAPFSDEDTLAADLSKFKEHLITNTYANNSLGYLPTDDIVTRVARKDSFELTYTPIFAPIFADGFKLRINSEEFTLNEDTASDYIAILNHLFEIKRAHISEVLSIDGLTSAESAMTVVQNLYDAGLVNIK